MKQYQITVAGIDNGFIIVGSGDNGQRHKKQAPDEESAKSILKEIVDHMFDEPAKKPAPEKTPA